MMALFSSLLLDINSQRGCSDKIIHFPAVLILGFHLHHATAELDLTLQTVAP